MRFPRRVLLQHISEYKSVRAKNRIRKRNFFFLNNYGRASSIRTPSIFRRTAFGTIFGKNRNHLISGDRIQIRRRDQGGGNNKPAGFSRDAGRVAIPKNKRD